MKKTIVAFDLDGTLTRKDTLPAFFRHTHPPLQRAGNLFAVLPSLFLFFAGWMNNGQAKQKLFSRFYKNWTLEKFNGFCRSFSPVIDGCIRPDVYQEMKQHLTNGHQVIIVSASIENWILPWATKEGVDTVLATRIEADTDGRLTGRFSSPNCYGNEKKKRILALFPERDSYMLIAYGDSKGDLDMLQMADEKHYMKTF